MFGIGIQEMLIILVVALIFFGPKRLPDLAKSLGKGLAEFRKASDEVRKGIEEAVKEGEEAKPPPEAVDAADLPVEARSIDAYSVDASPPDAATPEAPSPDAPPVGAQAPDAPPADAEPAASPRRG